MFKIGRAGVRADISIVLALTVTACSAPANEGDVNRELESNMEVSVPSANSPVSRGVSLAERTQGALEDQISCRQSPQPAKAIRGMLQNHMIRDTGDGADGSNFYKPIHSLKVFGMSVKRVTGWQPDSNGDPLPPFWRGPGTAPPTFIAVTVDTPLEEARRELQSRGLAKKVDVDTDPNSGTEITCFGDL